MYMYTYINILLKILHNNTDQGKVENPRSRLYSDNKNSTVENPRQRMQIG